MSSQYPPEPGQGGSEPGMQSSYPPPPDDFGQPQPYEPQGAYSGQYDQYQPPKQKGFNWLACCGITCGLLLLLTILFGILFWQMIAPIVGMGTSAVAMEKEVREASIESIQSSATPVDAATLTASPDAYDDQWIELTGKLASYGTPPPSSGQGQLEGTQYMLEPMIMVTDISMNPPAGQAGDELRAWGKFVVMDLSKMPFMGQMIKDEMAKDPTFQGNTAFIMFVAKQVELVGGASGESAGSTENAAPESGDAPAAEDTAGSGESSSGDSGW
jgi:hypothetical protein